MFWQSKDTSQQNVGMCEWPIYKGQTLSENKIFTLESVLCPS